MDNAKRELFCKALWQAFEEKRNEELALCEPSFEPSARHLHKVSRILGVDVQKEEGRRYYHKKRVLSLILAAVLLLVSAVTVYAYRGAILGFIEKIFDDHVEVGFDGVPADAPTVIEKVYELGYIPQGYHETGRLVTEFEANYYYEHAEGKTFGFNQYLLKQFFIYIDNERGDVQIKKYGERDVYCYISERECLFLWRDAEYAFQIFTSVPLSEEEILKTMDGIRTKQ